MNNEKLFGATLTVMVGGEIIPDPGKYSDSRSDILYSQVEAACEGICDSLRKSGLEAQNYEVMRRNLEEEQGVDFSSASDLPASDPRILVEAEWSFLEEFFEEYESMPLQIRLPLMSEDDFVSALKAVHKAVVSTFDNEYHAINQNDMGLNADLFYKTERPDFFRFMMNAPEAAWQAMGNKLYDRDATTLRQLCAPTLMRDIMLLGRENISPHSVRNAFRAPGSSRSHAVCREGENVAILKHFSSGNLLIEAEDSNIEGVLRRISTAFEGRSPSSNFMTIDPMTERLLDRLTVALNWAASLRDRIGMKKVISHGMLSDEGSTQMLIGLDGEVVMFLSEESGWVSVPDDTGEPGSNFMQKSGFSISDSEIILPLIALDLAEIMHSPEYSGYLPIPSDAFKQEIQRLVSELNNMGLIEEATVDVENNPEPV